MHELSEEFISEVLLQECLQAHIRLSLLGDSVEERLGEDLQVGGVAQTQQELSVH